MNYRILKKEFGYIASGINEHGRTVELDLTGKETLEEISILFINAKTDIEKEKEKVEEENIILQEENTKLKSIAEELTARYIENKETYDQYEVGKRYKLGDTFIYNNDIYLVISIEEFTAAEEWPPDQAHSLYAKIGAKDTETGLQELYPSTTNLYDQGAIGTFNGRVYKSLWPNNSNPVTDTGWWQDLGTIEEYLGGN